MTRKAYGTKVREEAYRIWLSSGKDMAKTVRELEKKCLPVARRTVAAWRDRYGWRDRAPAIKEEPEEARTDDAARLIADLEKQKARYDSFFDSLGEAGIDNQATYAYTTLVKTIAEVRKKAAEKPDLYAMTPVVMDEFVKFIKGKASKGSGSPGGLNGKDLTALVFDLIDRFFEEVKPG